MLKWNFATATSLYWNKPSLSLSQTALNYLCLEPLKVRRDKLCLKFAKKAEIHPKHRNWFKLNKNTANTRQYKSKYMEVSAKHKRFKTSPLSCLTNILNNHYNKWYFTFHTEWIIVIETETTTKCTRAIFDVFDLYCLSLGK